MIEPLAKFNASFSPNKLYIFVCEVFPNSISDNTKKTLNIISCASSWMLLHQSLAHIGTALLLSTFNIGCKCNQGFSR